MIGLNFLSVRLNSKEIEKLADEEREQLRMITKEKNKGKGVVSEEKAYLELRSPTRMKCLVFFFTKALLQ